jgi:hypothetical protein
VWDGGLHERFGVIVTVAVVELSPVRRPRGSMSAAAIERAARERAAVALRQQGRTFDEIAAELGFADRSGARKAVERGLSSWMRETDEELRARELERSEMIIDRLWPMIDKDPPDLPAIDRYMKLAEYRAKITGLSGKRATPPATYGSARNGAAEKKAAMVARYMELTDKALAGVAESGHGSGRAPDDPDDDECEWEAHLHLHGGGDAGTDETGGDDEEDENEEIDQTPGEWRDGRFYPSEKAAPAPVPGLSPDAFVDP